MQEERATVSPKILIASANRWFSGARLAMAFAAAGCRVEIVSPPGHPALLTRAVEKRHPYSALRPVQSLLAAMRSARPELIVPTDDVTGASLRLLFGRAPSFDGEGVGGSSEFIHDLLWRSLGDPESFACVESRTKFLTVARSEGIRALPTEDVNEKAALLGWLERNRLPAVLKADGTSGGEGVRIVRTAAEALRAWRRLRAPVGLARTMKQAVFNRDSRHVVPWILNRPRAVSIQPFIDGYDLNVAASCWRGEVLGAVPMEVLHAWRPMGPASVVRMSGNREMLEAVRILVRRLGLSGLCGFDFMVERATGRTYLIEINARATQTCHLARGVPCDPIPALVSVIAGGEPSIAERIVGPEVISLFPLAWSSGIEKEELELSYRDIPWEEPRLVEAGFAQRQQSLYERWVWVRDRIREWRPAPGEENG